MHWPVQIASHREIGHAVAALPRMQDVVMPRPHTCTSATKPRRVSGFSSLPSNTSLPALKLASTAICVASSHEVLDSKFNISWCTRLMLDPHPAVHVVSAACTHGCNNNALNRYWQWAPGLIDLWRPPCSLRQLAHCPAQFACLVMLCRLDRSCMPPQDHFTALQSPSLT